jgi:hypothetical protein
VLVEGAADDEVRGAALLVVLALFPLLLHEAATSKVAAT